MLGCAIVPDRDRISGPCKAHLIFGDFEPIEKVAKQNAALGVTEPVDAFREAGVDEQRGRARFRMDAND